MSRCWLRVTLLLLIPSFAAGQDPSWTQPIAPFTIADGLHYVGSAGLSAFLFTSDDGHILIDAPLDENVDQVLSNIRSLGFDPSDIRVQLASHAHWDHVGGLARMLDATGADLMLSAADAHYIRQGEDFGLATSGYRGASPDRILEHLDTVRVGDIALIAHLTPGHTPGCTTWSGTVEIDGEPLTFVSVCSLTVLGHYRIVGDDQTYPGQGADFCRSLAHLRTLDADVFLGTHGAFFRMAEKLEALRAGDARAFVDPDGLSRYLDSAGAAIERALRDQGHSGGCAALVG